MPDRWFREQKLRILIARHDELQKAFHGKNAELQSLKKVMEEQQKTISRLEEKIRTFKLTKTIENKEGAAEAKERINELVREIDKCIGLLNT
jgi:phage shock protein A